LKYNRRTRAIALSGVLIGVMAVLISLYVGWSVVRVTSTELQNKISKFYLAKAHALASLASVDHALPDSALLVEMDRLWRSEADLPGDEYICVVDDQSRLLLHTAEPYNLGSYVGDNELGREPGVMSATLADVVTGLTEYVGLYRSSRGEEQIAAFSPIPEKHWAVGVHRSREAIDEEISASIRPQLIGLLIISLGIIPLVLILMYGSVLRIIRSRADVQHALQRERLLIAALMKHTEDHIYFKDANSRFIKVNEAHARYLGLTHPDEAIGKSDLEFFGEAHAQQERELEKRIMETGQPSLGKEEHHFRDGEHRGWINATKQPLYDESGKIIGTFGISRDISDFVRTRIQVEEQSIFLEHVIESLQHPFMVINSQDYGVELANSAARRAEAQGRSTCFQVSHDSEKPCDSSEHPCPMLITKTTGQPAVVEHHHIDESGRAYAAEVHSYPIFNASGEVSQVIEYSLDISERKKVEQELQRKYDLQAVLYGIARAGQKSGSLEELCQQIQRSLSTILDTSNFFIALTDESLNTLSFPLFIDTLDDNPGTVDFGTGLTEYVIRTGKSLLADGAVIEKLESAGEVSLLGSPSKIWLGIPMISGNRVLGALVVQSYERADAYSEEDIELLEFVSRQIVVVLLSRQAEERLSASEKLKELLIDSITHDLRGPIGTVFNFSELAIKRFPDDPIIGHIFKGVEGLLESLDNTTHLSQLVLGEPIPMDEIDLVELLQGLSHEFRPSLEAAGMELELDMPGTVLVQANPMISEIFKNIISNAIKYAAQGKRIVVGSTDEGDSYLFSVSDFGETIRVEDRQRVFERKFQIKGANSRGRGLGLAIVRRIADAHHAQVWVEANQPKGNRFMIRIPKLQ